MAQTRVLPLTKNRCLPEVKFGADSWYRTATERECYGALLQFVRLLATPFQRSLPADLRMDAERLVRDIERTTYTVYLLLSDGRHLTETIHYCKPCSFQQVSDDVVNRLYERDDKPLADVEVVKTTIVCVVPAG